MRLSICILHGPSSLSIPLRPQLAEVYGGYFRSKRHNIFAIVSSTKMREYNWKNIRVYEIPLNKRFKKMRLTEKIVKKMDCNIIQVRNSVVNGIIGLYLKWKYQIPLVFQYTWPILEAWKEAVKLESRKRLYLEALRVKITDLSYLGIMQKADLVLPISKWMKQYLFFRGVPESKMLPFPDGVNPKVFSPKVSGEKKRKELGFGSSPVIVYAGTMDRLRKLDFLIRTFEMVKRKVKDAKLLMVGDGNDKGRLEKIATKQGVRKDVIFTGKVPYFDVPLFLAASNVAVSPIPPSNLYKVSSPLKVFEYMGAGKPVVANKEIPEQREVIRESQGGLLSAYEEENFAEAIIELLNNPYICEEMGKKGRKWVVTHRSYKKIAMKVESAYFKLLNLKR